MLTFHCTLQSLLTLAQGVFDLSKAVPIAGSSVTGQQSGAQLVSVGSDTYRLVLVNSGGQGSTIGSTGAATTMGYRLAGYTAASGGACRLPCGCLFSSRAPTTSRLAQSCSSCCAAYCADRDCGVQLALASPQQQLPHLPATWYVSVCKLAL